MVTIRRRDNRAKDLLEGFDPHYQKMCGIQGWLSDAEAAALFVAAASIRAKNPVVVEIGSFQGKSSVCIAGGLLQAGNDGHLFCVDPFDLTHQEQYIKAREALHVSSLYNTFLANTREYKNITAVPSFSVDASQNSPIPDEIDMLFIDGDHSYNAVMADIGAWVPSLKPGGVLALHDVAMPGDRSEMAELAGGRCADPIRVVCDLGLGLQHCGWQHTSRIETLFITVRKKDMPWLTLQRSELSPPRGTIEVSA